MRNVAAVTILTILAMPILGGMSPVSAQSICPSLDGEWSGRMKGRFTGSVTMTIRNCRVTWTLPDRRKNYCSFSDRGGKVSYSCSLGSQGTVVVQGNRITMRNTHTGNDYVVNVSKK